MSQGFFPSSLVHRERPGSLIAKCGSCGLFKHCNSPKMPFYGKGEKRVLIVGEYPGEAEDRAGRPFVGKAGQLLREILDSLGIDFDTDVWSTNALICHSRKSPDRKKIEYCHPNLLNTLKTLRPRVVITLGRIPLISILRGVWDDSTSLATMDRWAGWKMPLKDYWLCPTFHPSYILREESSVLESIFKKHLRSAFEIQNTSEPLTEKEYKIDILLEDDDVWEALKEIDRKSEWVSVDYETNCIKPEWSKARVISCSVSNGERTISYPWVGKAIKATQIFLKSKRTRKIASNLKMEERWTLKEFGHGVRNWGWDTMLAAHCLDNRTGVCSLKFQCLVQFGIPAYNRNIEPYLSSHNGHYNRISEIDLFQLLLYGGRDAYLEYRLAMKQRKDMGYLS